MQRGGGGGGTPGRGRHGADGNATRNPNQWPLSDNIHLQQLAAHAGGRIIESLPNVCTPPPPCISYANVRNYYGPYAYCSLDTGVAYAQ